MASNFYREAVSNVTADTPTTIYTVPASTTTVVIGFMVSNKTVNLVYVDIVCAGKSLGTSMPIPGGSTMSVIDGKLVLEASDVVTVECDTTDGVETLFSYMEITA